ncbi:Molybdenum cofactor cytidylyltransferase [bacterium HR23]|nr:Molybdenum cofactor cytidylyltransferase [bacterium HR23]
MASVSAVLLAAGESSRMGEPKALLLWQGRPLIQYQIASLADAGAEETVVVLGAQAHRLAPYVRGPGRLTVIINPLWPQGKTTSIVLGLREVSRQASGILVLAVDQPRPPSVLRPLLEAHERQAPLLVLPVYQGRRGHPPLFHRALLPELLEIREESKGLHAVVEGHRSETVEIPVDNPIVLVDLNTPEDYQEARRRFGA